MAATYNFDLYIVVRLSIRGNVIESQIRGFLVDSRADLEAKVNILVANAPSVAEVVLDDVAFGLKVIPVAPKLWEIYPGMGLTMSGADTITELQVRSYLEDYWDQFKSVLRNLIAAVPANLQAQIVGWHVHRLSGSVDEVE